MDTERMMLLKLQDAHGVDQLIMRISPSMRFGDNVPSIYVDVTLEEPESGSVRVFNAYLSEFDDRKYNCLGMLKQIIDALGSDRLKNDYTLTPPEHMTSPPRTRWLPPLGDWRGVVRRQLGR